jgi:predicted Rossmann fold nucleotide-binding protein DprA/Smf involved in DNA uptake
VWRALDERPVRIEELARLARLDSASVLAVLTELEVGGWVAQEAGMRFRKAS